MVNSELSKIKDLRTVFYYEKRNLLFIGQWNGSNQIEKVKICVLHLLNNQILREHSIFVNIWYHIDTIYESLSGLIQQIISFNAWFISIFLELVNTLSEYWRLQDDCIFIELILLYNVWYRKLNIYSKQYSVVG